MRVNPQGLYWYWKRQVYRYSRTCWRLGHITEWPEKKDTLPKLPVKERILGVFRKKVYA